MGVENQTFNRETQVKCMKRYQELLQSQEKKDKRDGR